MALLGTYEGRVDPQSRIVVPQRFRESLEWGVVLTRGVDGSIEAYPPREWDEVSARVRALPPFDRNARILRRITFSSAFKAAMDRQGRVVLPQNLKQFAGVGEEVVMTGQDTYFEIWSPERWQEQEAQAERLPEIAQSLGIGTLGIGHG